MPLEFVAVKLLIEVLVKLPPLAFKGNNPVIITVCAAKFSDCVQVWELQPIAPSKPLETSLFKSAIKPMVFVSQNISNKDSVGSVSYIAKVGSISVKSSSLDLPFGEPIADVNFILAAPLGVAANLHVKDVVLIIAVTTPYTDPTAKLAESLPLQVIIIPISTGIVGAAAIVTLTAAPGAGAFAETPNVTFWVCTSNLAIKGLVSSW